MKTCMRGRSASLMAFQAASTSGSTQRASEAIMVAYSHTRHDTLMDLIAGHCQTRSEMQIVSLAGDTMLLAEPVEVEVGGATVFALELERFIRL